jgi:hypothetical protein
MLEEMRRMEELENSAAVNRADLSRVPSGAVPSRDGVLSPRAAEFWFPECRDCQCCNGYKHGCKCCSGANNTCLTCGVSKAPLPTPPPASGHLIIEAPSDEPEPVRSPAAAPRSFGGAKVPVGMPSQGGVLSKHAAEFWFPECRECTCCKGYKHGCTCCNGGVTSCKCASGDAMAAPVAAAAPSVESLTTRVGDLIIEAPSDEPEPVRSPAAAPRSYGGAKVPVGMPSQGGVLSKHAAEFWFPECRECACCKGYKHGCTCCNGGVTSCKCMGETESHAVPAPAAQKRPCVYFARGFCQFGSSCKNQH